MNLNFNTTLVERYTSASQQARILTEAWGAENLYCPLCGKNLNRYEANRCVADFYCVKCRLDFELKSKRTASGRLGEKIMDGAYDTMIARITSLQNPNFFFLTHSNSTVSNLLFIPNYFFTPTIVEKRKPLTMTARRAGWVGCNINISGIPTSGKIFIVKNGEVTNRAKVISEYGRVKSLQTASIERRGWLMDVLRCVEAIAGSEFSLQRVYEFENELREQHPDNQFIRAKIRQQLQVLRDKGLIKFIGQGLYRKL